MEINSYDKKIVKLEDLLPFAEEHPLPDDQFFQLNKQYFDELVEILPIKNHEYGYWVYVRPDTNDHSSGKYEVDSGHDIVRAAKKAGLDFVTAVILPSKEELNSYPLEDEEVYFGAFNQFKKIRPLERYDDVKMISINKLIPFNRYPLELFKGKRFEDMVISVRALGVVQPIIVRSTIHGKYEILNGHYRVAAAKELKLNVIPAVIKDNLTDEEALFFSPH